MRRGNLRILAVAGLALALEAHAAQAGTLRPIIGQWCGIEGYMINVGSDAVFFRPRQGSFAPPAFNVDVGEDRVSYSQHYSSLEITVNCTLIVTGADAANETCDSPDESFYPEPGESAELFRCSPQPEPIV